MRNRSCKSKENFGFGNSDFEFREAGGQSSTRQTRKPNSEKWWPKLGFTLRFLPSSTTNESVPQRGSVWVGLEQFGSSVYDIADPHATALWY